ncbi:uncharacterized protein LOC109720498 isoform X3 [Ananas comosus]|uniref:Uncharacterized protein LOC109720498 isoform X3 n=1 Tax=Ananas comosus TaxID=4615 RepID=A0A6P5G4L6_ANACO|nr:uncharacterized protein LOC109720498 isoform X3 [Ananas comosus]
MRQASANRRSDYLKALTQEIERKLQKALSSSSQRIELLQQLFADIALEVDDRARDIILNRDERGAGLIEDRIESCLCFYEVLADHYVSVPEDGKRILDLIVQLWSQSFVSHIFTLLFHKWLFEVPLEETEALLRYGSALVQGATNVFWIDIQTNTRRFLSLFHYLLEEVALVPDRRDRISLQACRDLFLLLSRFILFYDLDYLLERFLKEFPTFPNSFLVGGPADFFVIELTDQLQKLKVEPVLLHYLSRMSVLQARSYSKDAAKELLVPFWNRGRGRGYESYDHFPPTPYPKSWVNQKMFGIGTEDDYKHKIEGMPLQLHVSWWSHLSNKSCATCSVEHIGFAFPLLRLEFWW